jgi:hypothetical protein
MAATNQFSLPNCVADYKSVLLPTSTVGLPGRNDSNACDNLLYDGVKYGTLEYEHMNS